jgi:hypothetical protein
MDEDIVWKPDLEEIEARYEQWLEKRTLRRHPSSRSAPNIVNPRGEALGPWNEKPPPSNDSYERDSFCALNNEEPLEESECGESQTTESSSGVESFVDNHNGRDPILPSKEFLSISDSSQEFSVSSFLTLNGLRSRRVSRSSIEGSKSKFPLVA